MSSTQFYISIFVPFLTLLTIYTASSISNRSAINDLRAEMKAGFDSLSRRVDGLDKRMDGLDMRLDGIEGKLDRLTEEVYRLHESRLSRLAERVFGRTA